MNSFRSCVATLLGLTSLTLVGCSSSPTQIIVTLNTDFAVPSQLDRIVVQRADGAGDSVSTQTFLLRGASDPALNGTVTLPLDFIITPSSGDAATRANLDIQGYADTSPTALVDRKVIIAFEKGKTLGLGVTLARACESVTCPGDQTCDVGGVCIPIAIGGTATTSSDAGVDANVIHDAETVADMSRVQDAAPDGATDAGMHDASTVDATYAVPRYDTTATQVLYEPDGGPGNFGASAALSRDGTTLAVADPCGGTNVPGRVYIFHKTGSSFNTAPLQTIANDTVGVWFASGAVALSADGSVLAITSSISSNAPGVYVYENHGGAFDATPAQIVIPAGTANGFERGIFLSGDGNTLTLDSEQAVYVFARDPTSHQFVQSARVAAPAGASAGGFGSAVSETDDGQTLAVSDPSAGRAGEILIFSATSGVFQATPTSVVLAIVSAIDWSSFGSAIALRGDGRELVVGAADAPGNLFIYARDGAGFSLVQMISGDSLWPTFGYGVALTSDGTTLLTSNSLSNSVSIFHGE